MLNDRTTTLSLLRTRRSGRPRDMAEPGPSAAELRQMLEIATRVPDHGKLHPWRFIHVTKERRGDFAAMLRAAYLEANPAPGRLELEAVDRLAHQAPELVVVISSPTQGSKIPVWEQELSCGAACFALQMAAHAMGYVAGWITGWAAYSDAVLKGLGGRDGERVAGFIYIGSAAAELEERVRPNPDEVIASWTPPAE